MPNRRPPTEVRPLEVPEKEPYVTPALTRHGTVDELTGDIHTDTSTTGSGIPI